MSVTFDDGFSGAARAAEILSAADMKGTLYLNSGLLDETGFMTLRQAKGRLPEPDMKLRVILSPTPDIDSLDLAEAKREICQHREGLLSLGVQVTNFAYPFSSGSYVESLVEDCGYNSGRGLGGTLGEDCQNCPPTESLRPADPQPSQSSQPGGTGLDAGRPSFSERRTGRITVEVNDANLDFNGQSGGSLTYRSILGSCTGDVLRYHYSRSLHTVRDSHFSTPSTQ